MLELFGLFGVASYCIASLVVGLHLMRLAGRTRQLPERLIGAAFLCGGTLGYTNLVAASVVVSSAPGAARVLFWIGWTGLVAASLCLLLFWQRVYHPEERASHHVVVVGMGIILVCFIGQLLSKTGPGQAHESAWYLPGLATQCTAYAINGWTSVRYWRMLRRRLSLGMADPVVVNRILLWSLAAWAITGQYLFSIGLTLLAGRTTAAGPETALISALGLAAASAMTLAFFSPRFYLRWVERGGAAATD